MENSGHFSTFSHTFDDWNRFIHQGCIFHLLSTNFRKVCKIVKERAWFQNDGKDRNTRCPSNNIYSGQPKSAKFYFFFGSASVQTIGVYLITGCLIISIQGNSNLISSLVLLLVRLSFWLDNRCVLNNWPSNNIYSGKPNWESPPVLLRHLRLSFWLNNCCVVNNCPSNNIYSGQPKSKNSTSSSSSPAQPLARGPFSWIRRNLRWTSLVSSSRNWTSLVSSSRNRQPYLLFVAYI